MTHLEGDRSMQRHGDRLRQPNRRSRIATAVTVSVASLAAAVFLLTGAKSSERVEDVATADVTCPMDKPDLSVVRNAGRNLTALICHEPGFSLPDSVATNDEMIGIYYSGIGSIPNSITLTDHNIQTDPIFKRTGNSKDGVAHKLRITTTRTNSGEPARVLRLTDEGKQADESRVAQITCGYSHLFNRQAGPARYDYACPPASNPGLIADEDGYFNADYALIHEEVTPRDSDGVVGTPPKYEVIS